MAARRLVMFGSPGTGKGTQAILLAKRLDIPHISTGKIFREAGKEGTELGLLAKSYTDGGNYVPDDIVIGIVTERLAREDCRTKGFILDGVPRTVPQAEALDERLAKQGMPLEKVIELKVDRAILVRRLTGRRSCDACDIDYNISFKPPRTEGHCDLCGGLITRRTDDVEEAISRRFDVEARSAAPLRAYYEARGLLVTIDGSGDVASVSEELVRRLG